MTLNADAEILSSINTAIVQALQQRDNDALAVLAEQQHNAINTLFAKATDAGLEQDIATLLQTTIQLNEHVSQQISVQKQAIVHEQFDLKRRTQALQHYSDTEQL